MEEDGFEVVNQDRGPLGAESLARALRVVQNATRPGETARRPPERCQAMPVRARATPAWRLMRSWASLVAMTSAWAAVRTAHG